ncbi:MAG: UDP-3-O-(3-hydroxymyristoyl)glucosamine N-acyltransferase [Planctomycetota bacterium]
MRLSELAEKIGATLDGDGDIEVTGVGPLDAAGTGDVTFLANRKYADQVAETNASAVIVAPGVSTKGKPALRAENPYLAFTLAVVELVGFRKHPHEGIHPLAHVDPTATVGDGTTIYPFVYVGPGATIGKDCVLFPNVCVYDGCVLGDRVTLHAGTVIGQDGFGYATQSGVHHKIPQAGNAVIGDDVEMGANCAVDRATLGSTTVGTGSKFSDLVAIGHGAQVGEHALLVAQVGIAGSTAIGHHATLGGQVGVAGHLKIGDNVTAAAQSGITDNVPDQTTVLGSPAIPISKGRRVAVLTKQLPDLLDRIKKLEQAVEELQTDNEISS